MAGPYATIDRVKKIGGLNEDLDYNLYRFSSPDELDAEIQDAIAVAKATIRDGNDAVYDAPSADQLTKITRGECYYALYFLYPALKARKVTGTHWPLDQEDSSRFAELIDTEWLALAQTALQGVIDVQVTGQTFTRPVLLVGPVIDPLIDLTLESEDVQLQEIADAARAWPTIPVVTGG